MAGLKGVGEVVAPVCRGAGKAADGRTVGTRVGICRVCGRGGGIESWSGCWGVRVRHAIEVRLGFLPELGLGWALTVLDLERIAGGAA